MAYRLAQTPAGRWIVLSALLAVSVLPGITDTLAWDTATYPTREAAQDEADQANLTQIVSTHTTI
jgi:hypothetical protein